MLSTERKKYLGRRHAAGATPVEDMLINKYQIKYMEAHNIVKHTRHELEIDSDSESVDSVLMRECDAKVKKSHPEVVRDYSTSKKLLSSNNDNSSNSDDSNNSESFNFDDNIYNNNNENNENKDSRHDAIYDSLVKTTNNTNNSLNDSTTSATAAMDDSFLLLSPELAATSLNRSKEISNNFNNASAVSSSSSSSSSNSSYNGFNDNVNEETFDQDNNEVVEDSIGINDNNVEVTEDNVDFNDNNNEVVEDNYNYEVIKNNDELIENDNDVTTDFVDNNDNNNNEVVEDNNNNNNNNNVTMDTATTLQEQQERSISNTQENTQMDDSVLKEIAATQPDKSASNNNTSNMNNDGSFDSEVYTDQDTDSKDNRGIVKKLLGPLLDHFGKDKQSDDANVNESQQRSIVDTEQDKQSDVVDSERSQQSDLADIDESQQNIGLPISMDNLFYEKSSSIKDLKDNKKFASAPANIGIITDKDTTADTNSRKVTFGGDDNDGNIDEDNNEDDNFDDDNVEYVPMLIASSENLYDNPSEDNLVALDKFDQVEATQPLLPEGGKGPDMTSLLSKDNESDKFTSSSQEMSSPFDETTEMDNDKGLSDNNDSNESGMDQATELKDNDTSKETKPIRNANFRLSMDSLEYGDNNSSESSDSEGDDNSGNSDSITSSGNETGIIKNISGNNNKDQETPTSLTQHDNVEQQQQQEESNQGLYQTEFAEPERPHIEYIALSKNKKEVKNFSKDKKQKKKKGVLHLVKKLNCKHHSGHAEQPESTDAVANAQ